MLFSGADCIRHERRGTCPHFYKYLDMGATVSRRTANKKLTNPVHAITKALAKTTNCTRRAKKWRGTTKMCPTFKFVPAPLML